MWERLMPRDKKNGERQKKNNLEAYRKKELDRVNAYKKKQNQSIFHAKHRDATHRWREGKKIGHLLK